MERSGALPPRRRARLRRRWLAPSQSRCSQARVRTGAAGPRSTYPNAGRSPRAGHRASPAAGSHRPDHEARYRPAQGHQRSDRRRAPALDSRARGCAKPRARPARSRVPRRPPGRAQDRYKGEHRPHR